VARLAAAAAALLGREAITLLETVASGGSGHGVLTAGSHRGEWLGKGVSGGA
jgi:hypothetical protein